VTQVESAAAAPASRESAHHGPHFADSGRTPCLELVASMAEVALGERKDSGWLDREHQNRIGENRLLISITVVKVAVAHQVMPAAVPPPSPNRGQSLQLVLIADADGIALDDDI
jgi:hypothetical protein